MELSEEKQKEYRRVFSIFARDGSDTIATGDLGDALRAMGCNPTEDDIEDLVNEAGERADESGKLEFDDFCDLISRRLKAPEVEETELMEAFRVFDKNQDGTLNRAELKSALSSLGMTKMTEEDFEEFLAEIDENEDGLISYSELVQVIIGKR